MARETEIKLKISDLPAFHRALKRMGARLVSPGASKVYEENVIFDTPQGGLAQAWTVAADSNGNAQSAAEVKEFAAETASRLDLQATHDSAGGSRDGKRVRRVIQSSRRS